MSPAVETGFGGIWTRFLRTPWSFKVLALLAVATGILPAVSIFPAAYHTGLNKLGQPVGVFYLALVTFPFYKFETERRFIRGFRFQAIAYAALMVALTLIEYFDDARLQFPNNPSFAFHDYQWLTGVVVPLVITTLALTIPASSLPISYRSRTRTAQAP